MTERLTPGPDQISAAVLALRGELDASGAGRVRERISGLVDRGVEMLVVDLRDLSFLGATGLGVLAGGAARLRQRRGSLVLVPPASGAIPRMLSLTGLDQVLEMAESPGQALIGGDEPRSGSSG